MIAIGKKVVVTSKTWIENFRCDIDFNDSIYFSPALISLPLCYKSFVFEEEHFFD
jgi:hypothetical protein